VAWSRLLNPAGELDKPPYREIPGIQMAGSGNVTMADSQSSFQKAIIAGSIVLMP
jgi:hypothetical protein